MLNKAMKRIVTYAAIVITVAFVYAPVGYSFSQPRPAANQPGNLLYWAQKLQQSVNAQNTAYQHKDNTVSWGDDGNSPQCFADCSGFINALMAKTFNWTDDNFKAEWGHKRMFAYHYYDAIVSASHFRQIKNINSILPGDIIALQYADRSEHEDNTGHVMLIAALPRPHRPSKVIEPNTQQYEVEVIDCSKSPHGKSDSRFDSNSGEHSGLGRGNFRLYTDEQGNITGYSWSTGNPKEGFNPFENPVVVGRFTNI